MKRFLLLIPLFFSFAVYAGEATLSWTAPTQNEDTSIIPPPPDPAALAGFKLYWGLSEGTYTEVLNIPDPLATSYVVSGLTEGETYYFVGTAYNEAGVESRFSNVAVKTIPVSAPPKPNPPVFLSVDAE